MYSFPTFARLRQKAQALWRRGTVVAATVDEGIIRKLKVERLKLKLFDSFFQLSIVLNFQLSPFHYPNGGEWCSLTQLVTETDRRVLNVRN